MHDGVDRSDLWSTARSGFFTFFVTFGQHRFSRAYVGNRKFWRPHSLRRPPGREFSVQWQCVLGICAARCARCGSGCRWYGGFFIDIETPVFGVLRVSRKPAYRARQACEPQKHANQKCRARRCRRAAIQQQYHSRFYQVFENRHIPMRRHSKEFYFYPLHKTRFMAPVARL
jgi:hypothetical protein